mgnify:CR=1 FL=1
MARKMTRGECALCNRVLGKRALVRHLREHLDSQQASGDADPEGSKDLVHILVDGKYRPEYWMHLEAGGDLTLARLDDMLRYEWLECCDHMSEFLIDGERYTSNLWEDAPRGAGMGVQLRDVLAEGTEFEHVYDFGSSTHLRLRVVGWRRGPSLPVTVRILARNEPPERACVRCGEPAELVCTGCCEGPEGTLLCGACGGDHGCDDERLVIISNSPRCGVCAYEGWD